jgi:hypothetical protein
MRILLGILGVLGFLFAVLVFSHAQSAIHEIEALIGGVIAVVSLGAVGIISAIESGTKQQLAALYAERANTAASAMPRPDPRMAFSAVQQ